MKVFSVFFVLLCQQMLAYAQNFSYVYALADTQLIQTSYWAEDNETLYNYRNVFGYGKDDPFNVFEPGITISKVEKDGSINWSRHINKSVISVEPFYQVFSAGPLLLLDSLILGAALFRDNDYAQRGTVFSWNDSGVQQWEYTPASSNSYFVGDQLLKIPNSNNFYVMGIQYDINSQRIISYELSQTGHLIDSFIIEIPGVLNNREYSVIDAVLGENYLTIALYYIDWNSMSDARMLLRCTAEGQIIWHKTFASSTYWKMLPLAEKTHVNETFISNDLSSVQSCRQTFDLFGTSLLDSCTEYSTAVDTTIIQVVQVLPHPNSEDYYLIGIQFSPFATEVGHNFVERYNVNGELIWKKIYRDDVLGLSFPLGFSDGCSITPSGNILISGSGFKEVDLAPPPYGISAVWVLSIDENGCFNSNCSDTIVINSVVKTNDLPELDDIKIYPNPVHYFFQIEGSIEAMYSVQVQDAFGRLMYSNPNYNNLQVINTDDWTTGIYFVHITKKDIPGSPYIVKKIAITRP